jgi:hypothetical protein
MKKKRKWKYLHLLNGQPASYDGMCVCYTNNSWFFPKLLDDLPTLRRQQAASRKWRKEHLTNPGTSEYDYQRIEV